MPFILFIFGGFLIFLFIKNYRIVISVGLIVGLSIFSFLIIRDESIQNQYTRLFQELNSLKENKFFKLEKNEITADVVKRNNISIFEKAIKKSGGNLSSGYSKIWLSSYEVWKEQPFFGYGVKSFRYKCRELSSKAGYSNIITSKKTLLHMHNYECSNHSHNYYIQLLAETGIIGMFLMILFFITILKDSFYYIKKYNKELNADMILLIPIIISLVLEIWPLRSSGSFFTTSNATIFWLYASCFISLHSIQKTSSYLKS